MSFLATSEFAHHSFNVLTFIGLPIHLLANYCILFKTPDYMRSMKWTLFNLNFWSMAMDLGISFLLKPVGLFPALAGYTQGFLNRFEVPTAVQLYLLMVMAGMTGVTTIVLFEHRYYLLTARRNWWRHFRWPFLVFNHLFACFYFLPATLYLPEQSGAVQRLFEALPELSSEMRNRSLFVVALEDYRPIGAPVIFMAVFLYVEATFFYVLTIWYMKKLVGLKKISKHTLAMQRQLLKIISIQVTIPFFIVDIPLGYLICASMFNIYNQSLNNLAMLFFPLYGMTSTVITLTLHKPYRRFCQRLFCMRSRKILGSQSSNTIEMNVNIDRSRTSFVQT